MVIDKEDAVQRSVSSDRVANSILWIRDQKVMLSPVLADMYGVEVRALIQAVKRNIQRFPQDFMFQLTPDEVEFLKSQNVISKKSGRGGAHRSLPYAFTEQGVAMLSSVLKGERAVAINIEIMRAFGQLRG
ncbi:MAG: ORF6N domain-containing protein, partial [Thiogranum sp.]